MPQVSNRGEAVVEPLLEATASFESLTPKQQALSMFERWKDNETVPIECLFNMMLLFLSQRQIVQLDISYYDDGQAEAVRKFVATYANLIRTHEDKSRNIIIYLRSRAEETEKELINIGGGELGRAFHTAGFATLLDPRFYQCKGDLKTLFVTENLVRVSIEVVLNSRRMGAILVQMCTPTQLKSVSNEIYSRFEEVSRALGVINPKLQTFMNFYTKPGDWKNPSQPEYVVDQLRELP